MHKNNNISNIVYKKKKLNKNNICIKKKKNDILSNSRGKIIDIDINLGKPIRDISDINPLESGFFLNENNKNKKLRGSLSTNKREKKRRKNRSKNKKLSLPKKKYLEEKYDSSSGKDDNEYNNDEVNEVNSFDKNSINDNFTIKTNNNIIQPFMYKSSRIVHYKNQDKKESEKCIVTSDRRLYININHISDPLYENKLNKLSNNSSYNKNSLLIKRNIYFPIFGQNLLRNKTFSNRNYFYLSKTLTNSNKEANYTSNDKYLNSCVKFLTKSINKVFLKKCLKYFMKECEIKFRKFEKKKIERNQGNNNKIFAYKKKIGKN